MQKHRRFLSLLLAGIMMFGIMTTGMTGTVAAVPSGNVINVTDFGADPTGTSDSTVAVEKAVEAAKKLPAEEAKTIYFPKGEYHFHEETAPERELYVSNTLGLQQDQKMKRIGILLEDLENVTVDGGNSMFMYHGDITTFAVIRSKNVTIRNFSVEHASPSVVDVTIESRVENENAVIAYVPSCYTYEIQNGNGIHWMGEKGILSGKPYWEGNNRLAYCQIYDTNSGRCWRGGNIFENVAAIEPVGNDRLKFTYTNGNLPTVGYSYEMRNTTRTTPGAFIWESENVMLQNLNIHFLHGFGIVGQLSKDITLDTLNFRTRPESGRTTVGFADFVQMSSVGGKVTIRNCDFTVAHDDPINVHGTFLTVEEVSEDGKTLTLRYRHNETAGFPQYYVGDQVDFSTKGTMVPVQDSLRTVEKVIDSGWGKDTIKIQLDRPVEGLSGGAKYVIENVTYTPEVHISGCRFANIPTRGILVTTRKPVLIENNYFDAMNMASIFISCDAQGWYESGHTENVTIRNNIFDRPGSEGILVEPTGSNDRNHQLHTNMTIENNIFNLDNSVSVVNAKSVKNLTIRNNVINRYHPNVVLEIKAQNQNLNAGDQTTLSTVSSGADLSEKLYRFENCREVTIQDNVYDGGLNRKIELTAGTAAEDITILNDDLKIGKNHMSAPGGEIHYMSSDPSVLTVNAGGEIFAVAAGTAEVRAYTLCGNRLYESNALKFTVAGEPAELGKNLTLSSDKTLMNVGETQKITTDAGADRKIIWSVRGDAVTVSDAGIVTAEKSGVAEVTATTQDRTASGTILIAVRAAVGIKSDAWTVDRDRQNWTIDGANDTLTIRSAGGGDWATGNGAVSLFLTEPNGSDFTAEVKLHNKTQSGYEEAGLVVFTDSDNYVALERKHGGGSPNLAVVTEANGAPNEDGAVADTFGDELWLKLEKKGNTLTGFYTENGQNWKKIRSVTNDALENCKVGVIACNSNYNTPFTFSDFSLDAKKVPFAMPAVDPTASDAAVTISDHTATVNYTFAADHANEGKSVYRWFLTTQNGVEKILNGAAGKTIDLKPEYADCQLKAAVVPVDAYGRLGQPVISKPVTVPELAVDPQDASLSALDLGTELFPGFRPDTTEYSVTIPASVDTIPVVAKAVNANAKISVMLDDTAVQAPVKLTKEQHTLAIRVSADGAKAEKTYKIHVERRADSRAALESMTFGNLYYDPTVYSYHVLCGADQQAMELSLSAVGTVTVTHNNKVLAEGQPTVKNLQIPCVGGLNTLEIKVTAEDGVTNTIYRVAILKPASDNTRLSSVTVNGAELPGFDNNVKTYKYAVTGTQITVAARPEHENASVQILAEGKPVADGVVELHGDVTKVTIRVTAENGNSVSEYTLHVIRDRADNADLLDLSFDRGSFTFDPAQHTYHFAVNSRSLKMSAEAVADNAVVCVETNGKKVTETGKISTDLALVPGENMVRITVTAPDGISRQVTEIEITVELSTYLSDLDWQSASTGDGSYNGGKPVLDHGWEGYQVALADAEGNEKVFGKGLGVHADSTIVYDLSNCDFDTFTAAIGVSYKKFNHKDDPRLKFSVIGDEQSLYESKEMTSTTPYEEISVDISGVKELKLVVKSTKGNVWSAHGTWADAKLSSGQGDHCRHELFHVEAHTPTCMETGNLEHWRCTLCGKYFSDESGTHEISAESVKKPMGDHAFDQWQHDEMHHWKVCSSCGLKEESSFAEHIWVKDELHSTESEAKYSCVCGAERTEKVPEPEKPVEPTEPQKPTDPQEPQKPTDPQEPQEPSVPLPPSKPTIPTTGDDFSLMLLGVLMMGAAGAFGVMLKMRKKNA